MEKATKRIVDRFVLISFIVAIILLCILGFVPNGIPLVSEIRLVLFAVIPLAFIYNGLAIPKSKYAKALSVYAVVCFMGFPAFAMLFDMWQLRLAFMLISGITCSLIFLLMALNPKYQFVTDRSKIANNKIARRRLEIALHLLFAIIGFFTIVYFTMEFPYKSWIFISHGCHFEQITGVVERSSAEVPRGFWERDYYLRGSKNPITFVYGIGKHIKSGKKYTFYILPGTRDAFDVKPVWTDERSDPNKTYK